MAGRLLGDGRLAPGIILTLVIGTFVHQLLTYLNHDTAWYLHAGAQFLDGGQLYRDIFVEVNPPLAFFLALPPVILARLTGLFAVDLFVVYFYLLITVSLIATWRLLNVDENLSPLTRRGFLILAAIVMTICPADQFGQREHFLMVMVLPYLVLAVLNARGLRPTWSAALGVGLVAGLSFTLKPHYLLVPLALEAYSLAIQRRWRAWLRPETLGLTATVGLYGVVVVWFTPDYLMRIVPYALEVYNQAYQNPLWLVLWCIETVMLPIVCLAHVVTRRNQKVPQFGDVLLISSSIFFLAYVVQSKGWSYHIYPASTCLILACGALFLNHLTPSHDEAVPPTPRSLTRGIAVAALALAAVLAGNDAAHLGYKNRFTDLMTPYVERYARNGSIAILGSNVWPGFPLVNYSDVGWSSRFPTLWLLAGAVHKRNSGEAANAALLDEMEDFTRDSVIADLAARPPELVIVDDREIKSYFGPDPFDYLDYFGEDPRFTRIWSDYVWVAEEVGFDVYRRRCAPDCSSLAMPRRQ